MGNDFHLLSVMGTQNQSKIDKGPEGYMPPDRSYWCEYVTHWVAINRDWDLAMTVEEEEKVQEVLGDC